MRYLRLILIALLLCGVAGYAAYARLENGSPTTAKAADGGAQADKAASPSKPASPRVAVVSAAAGQQTLPVIRTAVGWVEPVATVTVRARIDGEVIEQHVQDGQFVGKGDLLFKLDDREIQAAIAKDEAVLARDQATLARAQADAKRARDLLARNVAPAQQVDQTEADAKIAAANIQADQATVDTDRIKLGYTNVTAPIDGRVGVVRVTPGNLVRSGDTGDGLVTITQMRPVRVSFTLPERDLTKLREAQQAERQVPVKIALRREQQARATGTLNFIDSSVDQATGTITAKAQVANDDGALWPGQYVDVTVEIGTLPDATTVPLVAVQPGQDGPFVYVVKPDGTAALRQIKTGETYGDQVVVASGLAPGERVVTEGQLRLRDGMQVADTKAGQDKAPVKTAGTPDGERS